MGTHNVVADVSASSLSSSMSSSPISNNIQHHHLSSSQSNQPSDPMVTRRLRSRTLSRGRSLFRMPSASTRSSAYTDTPFSHRPRLMSSASAVIDRKLLEKYEQVNGEIERIVRESTSIGPEDQSKLEKVKGELRRVRLNSSQMLQSQKHLLEKMEKQEKSSIRRFFTLNRAAKMEKLKAKLCDKLSESVRVDEELQRLERKSTELSQSVLRNSSASDADMVEELQWLEREKEDILSNLFHTVAIPDVQDVHARIAMYASEMKACESIKKQVDKVETMYRQSLHLLRIALASVVSPNYSGTLREFAQGPYPLAVEASQLLEAATHVIQPEATRRYHDFAPELVHVRPAKFPQAVIDFARRARTNYDPHSALSIEGTRKLRSAENVIILLQRLAMEKLQVLENWQKRVDRDYDIAESAHRKLEMRLQQQVSVLAQSVDV